MARPKLSITVFFVQEADQVVAFAPALDLSTCGKNVTDAKQRFEKALDLFFEELEEMGTTEKALTELGWRRMTTSAKPWRAPSPKVPTHLLSQREMRVPIPA